MAPHVRRALIRGEAGSGKQMVARTIHALSAGAGEAFVGMQASALTVSFLEDGGRTLLDQVGEGTLYLEEVDRLTSVEQQILLRFLCAVDIQRRQARHSELRILAGCGRELRVLCAAGQFRQDLYAKLAGVEILLPALRDRMEDIPELAACMVRCACGDRGGSVTAFDEGAIAVLYQSSWPGNVQQLRRVLERAAQLAGGGRIGQRHLLPLLNGCSSVPGAVSSPSLDRLQQVVDRHVLDVLTRCRGNKLRAAVVLGISRSTLYRMLDASRPGHSGRPS